MEERGPRHAGRQGEEPFPASPASEKGEKVAVYEKGTGCFSWKEEKSSDRGKILIPQKIKQCGFQLGLVRGLFPLVHETSHKSLLSPRAFQNGDAKQNCTVRERLAGPKERQGSGKGWAAISTDPLPCHCHAPCHPASLCLPLLSLWLAKCQQRVSRDEKEMGAMGRREVTATDRRKDDLAACCVLRGRKGATALVDGGTITMVCTGVLVGMGIPVSMGILMGIPESIPMSMSILGDMDISIGMGILMSMCSSWLGLASPPLPLLCRSCSCSTLSAEWVCRVGTSYPFTQGYEVPINRVHVEGTFFCKNAAENAAKQRSSWANSRANPPDDYSDFLISTETSVLMKCTEVKQPWKCQCKEERPPNRH